MFLSHTSELADFPAARSYVIAAADAVTRAGDAVSDMAYFTAREDRPSAYCRDPRLCPGLPPQSSSRHNLIVRSGS